MDYTNLHYDGRTLHRHHARVCGFRSGVINIIIRTIENVFLLLSEEEEEEETLFVNGIVTVGAV